jgi:hypothetical protein
MSRGAPFTLADEVAKFQADLRRLAYQLVHQILRQELERKRAQLAPGRTRKPAPAPARRTRKPARRAARRDQAEADVAATAQLALALAAPPSAPPEAVAATEATEATEGAVAPSAAPAVSGKRVRWTRDSIIEELAKWLVGGSAIDPGFMTRHGPPGVVAAARRIFGRFDAALNVASLHVSRLYPDGPPARRPDQRDPRAVQVTR